MKSLAQLRNDKRVASIDKCDDLDFGYKYEVWLNEGWVYEDGSHVFGAESIADINEQLSGFVKMEKIYE